jgi:hypothetical protein
MHDLNVEDIYVTMIRSPCFKIPSSVVIHFYNDVLHRKKKIHVAALQITLSLRKTNLPELLLFTISCRKT